MKLLLTVIFSNLLCPPLTFLPLLIAQAQQFTIIHLKCVIFVLFSLENALLLNVVVKRQSYCTSLSDQHNALIARRD